MNFSFPRQLRLLKSFQYTRVFQTGNFKAYACGMMVLACPNKVGHVRLGLVCSRKQQRHAVDRNLFKRLCRESLRYRQHQLPAVDIVVLTRQRITQLDRTGLTQQIALLWQRLEREF